MHSIYRRVAGVVAGLVVVFAGAYLVLNAVDRGPHAGVHVAVYVYDPALDQGPGGPQCSEAGLVPVDRIVPRTRDPITDAVRLLLDGRLTDEERSAGLLSEYPVPGLTLASVTVLGDTAVVTLADTEGRSSGGACRTSILRLQLEATVTQFPGIRNVRIEPEELFQP